MPLSLAVRDTVYWDRGRPARKRAERRASGKFDVKLDLFVLRDHLRAERPRSQHFP